MTGQLGDYKVWVCLCVCVFVCESLMCTCVCVYDHVRMWKCVMCMCAFVYVNYNELQHSPQHTTLCTDTSHHTLHLTLHTPHRNLKPQAQTQDDGSPLLGHTAERQLFC